MTAAEPGAGQLQVTFDDQVFALQHRGGISRYFCELLRQFRDEASWGVEPVTPFRYVVNEHLLELDPAHFRRATLPSVAQRDRVLRPLNRLVGAKGGGSGRASDVLHHTYYLPDGLQRRAPVRVCTIYDMTPELFPELFPSGNPHQAKRQYVEACDAVLCISQTTKDDLIATYGELDKPVVVSPLGVGPRFFNQAPRAEGVPDYVLHVGQRSGYKNFDVLARALARLAGDHPALTLLCVGPAFSTEEQSTWEALGVADRIIHRSAGDDELPALFAGALCFAFPSRYEGFGLPIVEAFAAGCPVLLAHTPCSREVGGAAAQYVAPDDDAQLAALIEGFVSDPSSRTAWITLGAERAVSFTWERTAAVTCDLYRGLVAA